jgi:hypothetical protein
MKQVLLMKHLYIQEYDVHSQIHQAIIIPRRNG